MDGITALVQGIAQSQAAIDTAAAQVAIADLPTQAAAADVMAPSPPSTNVDVADQLTTLMVAADAHHLTTSALRAALNVYQDAMDVLMP